LKRSLEKVYVTQEREPEKTGSGTRGIREKEDHQGGGPQGDQQGSVKKKPLG